MIRLLFCSVLVSGLTTAANAQATTPLPARYPVALSAMDAANIRQICDLARRAPEINFEAANSIVDYCANVLKRINEAAPHVKPPPMAPSAQPK